MWGGGGGGHVCCIVKCCNCHFISAGDMAGVVCRGLMCVCVCVCMCVCAVGKMEKDIDWDRKCIIVFNTRGKEVRTIAHDDMTIPYGVAVDKDESVYVTDWDTGSVFKFSRDGRLVKMCKEFQKPVLVTVAVNRVFVSEDEGLVHILDRDLIKIGKIEQARGRRNGQFTYPRGVVQAGAELFVADAGNNRIQVFDLEGHFVRTFGKKGTASETVQLPVGLCFDPPSEFLYVSERDGHCVSVFRPGGEFVAPIGKMAPPLVA